MQGGTSADSTPQDRVLPEPGAVSTLGRVSLHLARRAPHVALWGVAILLFRLLAWPRLCMAGLDVELLIMNLYEQHAAPRELAPLAHAALRFGPAPLLIAALATALYALLPRSFGLANPLPAASPRSKALLAAGLLLPLLAAIAPLSVAISLWVCVEGFHWIEWQADINPFVDGVLRWGPVAVAPGLLVGAALLTRWVLGLRSDRRRGAGPLIGRGLARVAILAALLPMSAVLLAAAPQASRSAAPGRVAFQQKCGGCHFRSLALSFDKTPAQWRTTVERMATTAPSLSPADVDAITAFLSEARSTPPEHVLRTRCLRCHGSTHRTWSPRPTEQWGDLVRRMARWSPAYFSLPEQERLGAVLTDLHGDEGATVGESTGDWRRFSRLAGLCQDCHSVSWNADRFREADFDETRRMVVRMSTKLTEPLEPEEIDAFTTDYRDLMADPARFDRLFPHDRPVPTPAPPEPHRRKHLSPNRGGY